MNPTELTSYQLYILLSRSQRRVNSILIDKLKENSLGLTEWSVLGLARDYAAQGGIKPSQLAQLLDVKTSLVTATINILKARDLITVETDPNDKRAKRVATTRAGEKIVDKSDKQIKARLDGWFGSIDQKQMAGYIKTLQNFASKDSA